MNYNMLGFFMGLVGSIHCTLMCGPLLFALQQNQEISFIQILNKIVYQLGRILMYGIIGLVLGLVGVSFALKGWQQGVSLLTGVVLIIIGISYFITHRFTRFAKYQNQMVQPIAKSMGRWLNQPNGAFMAGMLNGLLPCGMVYMASASAMNAETIFLSFQFMICFGLGTLPLMLIFSFATYLPKKMLKINFSKVLPMIYLIMGGWFLLRGANLDIPYLSPLLYVQGAVLCN